MKPWMMALMLALAPLLLADAQPADHYVLDPHGGEWLHGPDLPSARQDAATAVLGGRIYVIGGFGPDSSPTNTTFVLEPSAGTNLNPSPDLPPLPTLPLGSWSASRSIPEAVDHAAAASLDGYIYVAGGTIEKMVTNKFWRYDPIADSWASLPPLPIPRYGPTMQALGGKLYLVGGATSHGNDETSIEVYDPDARSWSLIPFALGVEREAARTVLFEGRIAIVGGRDREERNQASCDLFDPNDLSWKSCSEMHLGRSGFGLAAVGDQLFAIGGVNVLTGVTTQTTEISGTGGQGWMDGRWLPAPTQGMSVAVIGHTVWVIGGANWEGTSPIKTVLRYVIPLVKVRFGGRAPQ
jgi:N-acetylneuraminic acid mutarotase